MGKVYEALSDPMINWIQKQQLFFVGTAPLSEAGHINISPKGLDTLRILSPITLAYLDLTGSGIETIAHIRENKRVVLMFCAFEGAPKIVRVHGQGKIYQPGDTDFETLIRHFPSYRNQRAIIHITATRISDSCGYGVPLYAYEGQRDVLDKWAASKSDEAIQSYQAQKNATSIDGLPGLEV